MIVCVCRRVSDRDIHQAVHNGAACFDDLQIDTGVATQCGRCEGCVREVLSSVSGQPLGGRCAVLGRASLAQGVAA